jgi:hypothetical protein
LAALASAAGTSTVHLFSRWLPSQETLGEAACLGIEIASHPLSSVERVSLVSGTRRLRWGPPRAA